jgi:NADH-quinone oxidoreductase subunit A
VHDFFLERAGINENAADNAVGEKKAMLTNYFPVLLFIVIGLAFGAVLTITGKVLSGLIGVDRPNSAKLSPYECGFDVRYYLVAILFILFDLEIAFLFPWAVALQDIGIFGFMAMMVFLAILVVGFVYEWKKGALDWE